MATRAHNEGPMTALLIAPNRELAEHFLATLPQTRAFQVLADLKNYPPAQTLEMRSRQLKPDVVLIDVASDLEQATRLIGVLVGMGLPLQVVGLHTSSDSNALVQTLRAGGAEFLHAPFELNGQRQAIERLRRLGGPEPVMEPAMGRILGFTSAKPGSGASTIATQTAFSLQRQTNKRVLLADFDLMGGTIGFYLKLSHPYSVIDALQNVDRLDPSAWSTLAVNHGGLDILPSPAAPFAEAVDQNQLRALFEQAKQYYDWIILDLPVVFSRTALMAVAYCETAYLVSTSELPSLHLTRKAITLADQLGFPKNRLQVVVNRLDKRDDLSAGNLEKLFNAPVYVTLPNDYFSLHRVVTLGQPLGTDGELGKAIEKLATRLVNQIVDEKKTASKASGKPALSVA